ncbi:MAG: hypothetical protein J1G02_01890 [Clostridiales bacterium]|nr:hypothetical protein [Clostridiales bacterium]
MDYINTVLNFLNDYSAIIMPVLFATVIMYGVINWMVNPYRKQNKRLSACYRGVCAYPDKVVKYAEKLPQDYRRQWRACINCGAKPSLVFEFVPKRKRLHLLWLYIIAASISANYVVVFFATARNYTYLVFQAVLWLAFGLVTVANRAVNRCQQARARKIFAKLITQFNRCAPFKSSVVEDTVKQLQQLNRHTVNDAVIGKASELLRNKGLETNRTVEEQRKINSALNSLLQAYSRNSLHKKA